jgi:hypothetical protein
MQSMVARAKFPEENPHCMQARIYARPCMKNTPFKRIISPDAGRMVYTKRDHENHTVIFQYYRRELIESIEFLIQTIVPHEIKQYVFVFVGAAPGYDVAYLRILFPSLHFVLFDPKPITAVVGGHTEIYQELFTDAWAHKFRKRFQSRRILLQCYTRISHKCFESNLQMIRNWHKTMRVHRGAYELTLPYDSDGSTTFIKGDLYFPVWSKPAGADCRLITDCDTVATINYSHRKHEESMAYFNSITRTCIYNHDFKFQSVYDACYDCTAEKCILFSFVTDFLRVSNRYTAYKKLKRLSADINTYFHSVCPSLPDWFIDPNNRREQPVHCD